MQKLFCFLAIVALFSCENQLSKVLHTNEDGVFYHLSPSAMYQIDSVAYARANSNYSNKSKSQISFLTAIDAYINHKDAVKGEQFFIESIALFPQPNTYFEYAKLKSEQGKYDEAKKLFEIAEFLQYKPLSGIMYQLARINAIGKETYESIQYLEYAIQAGYSDIKGLESDPVFEKVKIEMDYIRMKDELLGEHFDSKKAMFYSFLSNFIPMNEDIEIDFSKSNREEDNRQYLSFEFEKYVTEMRTADKFSRETGESYLALYKSQLKNGNTAVVYVCEDQVYGEDSYSLSQGYLVTYDSVGVLLDKKMIAGLKTYKDNFLLCKIKNNAITIKEHNKNWIKPEDENDSKKVKLGEMINEKKWYIHSNGDIKEEIEQGV
jgi:hypothetical protein